MTQKTLEKLKIDQILKELKLIRNDLQKFLALIPEESLDEYENPDEIKKAYLEAILEFPPEKP